MGYKKVFGFNLLLAIIVFATILCFSQTVGATTTLEWDYSLSGYDSTIPGFWGSSNDGGMSGYTAGYTTSHLHGNVGSQWGQNSVMYLQFEATGDNVELESLEFQHYHNHNYYSSYWVNVYMDGGEYNDEYVDRVWAHDTTYGDVELFDLSEFDIVEGNDYTISFVKMLGTGSIGTDWFSIDNVALSGRAVPEPTTMLLLGTGLLGFAGARRKMRK